MAGKEGHFDVLKLIVTKHFMCSNINLNTQDVDGMTPFDLIWPKESCCGLMLTKSDT